MHNALNLKIKNQLKCKLKNLLFQFRKKVGDYRDGDLRKPKYLNSRGEQRKDQEYKPYDGNKNRYDKLEKPTFQYNDKRVEKPLERTEKIHTYEKPQEKLEVKKFTGLLTQAAEENSKIKITKNYLEVDANIKYKEPEPEIEKPKFLNKNVETQSQEPHFKDINKNEDVNFYLF